MVVRRIAGFALVCASVLSLACGSAAPATEVAVAPEGSAIEISELVGQLRDMAWAEEVDAAQALIEQQRPHHDPSSPAWLVAASWLGRGAGFAERWDVAEQYAREAYDGSVALLDRRELDAEGQLPTALGAGIEVLGRVQDARSDRPGAVEFLTAQRERYRGTSIETRIQKNALLLGSGRAAVSGARCRAPSRRAAPVSRQPEGQSGRRLLLGALVSGLQAAAADSRAAP